MDILGTFRARRRRWMAQSAPAIAASAAKPGTRALVEGVAQPLPNAAPLAAPFTSERSVFYETTKAGEYHHEEEREHSTAPFMVVSYDDSVLVVEPTVAVHEIELVDVLGVEDRRWRQARIAPGDHVRVFGMVDETAAVTQGAYRAEATTIPRIRGTTEEPVVIARGL